MLIDYLPILILLIVATGLAILVISLGHLIGPRRPNARKNSPYESGMVPIGPGTRQVPVRFYMIAVLFILFDIEVIFFLPFAVSFRALGWFGIIEIAIFIVILIVGYIYAWEKRSPRMGVEQKLGNMGDRYHPDRRPGQLGPDLCDVAHVVWPGLLRNRNDDLSIGEL